MEGLRPTVSVVVVSDYGGRTAADWSYLRDTCAALVRQESDERVEVLLADANPDGEAIPAEITARLPGLRRLRGSRGEARQVINRCFEAASADLVLLLDGDCAPDPGWLRAAVGVMQSRPDAAAVSGRTVYPQESFSFRILGALSRSFVDPGRAGPTAFISSNNAIFRREILLAHPLRELSRQLATRLQSEAIRAAGGKLYFEPRMRVVHRFQGWPMERRIRRGVGYHSVRVRQLDPSVPHAWMLRAGWLAIPLMIAARTVDSWWDCLRVGRHYGVRWFETPAAMLTAIGVHALEIGGMAAAISEARAAKLRR